MARKRDWQIEFDIAGRVLSQEAGELAWATDNHVAFRFIGEGVRIVFYPHKTSARNYHIRVRDEGSKDKAKAHGLMLALDIGAGNNCTFQRKHACANEVFSYADQHSLEFGWANHPTLSDNEVERCQN